MEEFKLSTPPGGVLTESYINWLKSVLLKILVDHKDLVEKWINDQESHVFDAVVALVASQNAVLAAVLSQVKDNLVSADDGITEELLSTIIKKLQGNA